MTWTGALCRRWGSARPVRFTLEAGRLEVDLGHGEPARSWDLATATLTRRHWGLAGGTVLQIAGVSGELTVGVPGHTDPALGYEPGAEAPQITLAASEFAGFERALAEAGLTTATPVARWFTLWRNPDRPRSAYRRTWTGLLAVGLLGVAGNLPSLPLAVGAAASLLLVFTLLERRFSRLLKQPALSLAFAGDELVLDHLPAAGPPIRVPRAAIRIEPFRWRAPPGRAGGSVWDFPAVTLRLRDDLVVSVGAAAVSPRTTGPSRRAPAYLINPAWYTELLATVMPATQP